MPERALVSKALADLLGILAHQHRILIIQELRDGERDVNTLRMLLGISHSGVSQHLSVLRAHRLVAERRQGRQVFYHLCQPRLARWLVEAIEFVEGDREEADSVRNAINSMRTEWSTSNSELTPPARHNKGSSKE